MKPLTIILIIVGIGALLAVGLGVGIYFWIQSNQERLKVEGEAVKAEAAAFAAKADQQGCLDESLRRLDACGGLICRVKAKVFLENCGKAAKRTEGFCAGAPPPDEIIATATWSVAHCETLGRPGDQECARLLQAIQDICHDEEGAGPDG